MRHPETRTIRKNDVVAVMFSPINIYLRRCGKENYGKEKKLCSIRDGTRLIVDAAVANEFGLDIELKRLEESGYDSAGVCTED